MIDNYDELIEDNQPKAYQLEGEIPQLTARVGETKAWMNTRVSSMGRAETASLKGKEPLTTPRPSTRGHSRAPAAPSASRPARPARQESVVVTGAEGSGAGRPSSQRVSPQKQLSSWSAQPPPKLSTELGGDRQKDHLDETPSPFLRKSRAEGSDTLAVPAPASSSGKQRDTSRKRHRKDSSSGGGSEFVPSPGAESDPRLSSRGGRPKRGRGRRARGSGN
jgi:hypothetical protein